MPGDAAKNCVHTEEEEKDTGFSHFVIVRINRTQKEKKKSKETEDE